MVREWSASASPYSLALPHLHEPLALHARHAPDHHRPRPFPRRAVQKEMYPNLSAEAHVYAPLGPDLIDYLGRIARSNSRADQPTGWCLAVQATADFQAR